MRTLLIHQVFATPDQPGGTRHYEFARNMIQSGDEFSVVASDLSYKTGRRIVDHRGLVAVQQVEGIQILRTYTFPSLHRGFAWRVVSFLSFMLTSLYAALRAGPIDLVMGTSPPIFQAPSAWLVSKLRRSPFLLEVRDLWPEFAIDIGVLRHPVLIGMSRWLERFLYARAKHILVNSPAYVDYLVDKGVAVGRITLIPNGVDTDMFGPDVSGEAYRAQWNLDGKFVVSYVGAFGLANDLSTILNAAHQLRDQNDIHFLMVGDGQERDRLEDQAAELGLNNVTFTGAVAKSEVPQVLAASDACIAILKDIPMFRTTYPNKVFDYMAAGRPTILAIDGVIRQVVEAAEGGLFVPPGSATALADAIRQMSQDREGSKLMGQAARDYVVAHFDRRQHAQQFSKLAHRLIEEGGRQND